MTLTTIPTEDRLWTGLSDTLYHADRGSISSSGARRLLAPSSPEIFRWEQDHPRPPIAAYDFGHVAHELVLGEGSGFTVLDPAVHGLGKDGAPAANPRATTAWKQAEAEAREQRLTPIHIDDYRAAQAMRDRVMQHRIGRHIFESEGQPEISGYHHDPETGVRLRFRPDWLCQVQGQLFCVDYKTSKTADPEAFGRSVGDFGYHMQAPWYLDGLAALGIPDAEFLFVVQSKTAPYPVAVHRLAERDIDLGRRRNRAAINLYHQCVERDEWPGFGDSIHTTSIPNWLYNLQEQELA